MSGSPGAENLSTKTCSVLPIEAPLDVCVLSGRVKSAVPEIKAEFTEFWETPSFFTKNLLFWVLPDVCTTS